MHGVKPHCTEEPAPIANDTAPHLDGDQVRVDLARTRDRLDQHGLGIERRVIVSDLSITSEPVRPRDRNLRRHKRPLGAALVPDHLLSCGRCRPRHTDRERQVSILAGVGGKQIETPPRLAPRRGQGQRLDGRRDPLSKSRDRDHRHGRRPVDASQSVDTEVPFRA